jgi:hypothetical protein
VLGAPSPLLEVLNSEREERDERDEREKGEKRYDGGGWDTVGGGRVGESRADLVIGTKGGEE